jgi:hypothetical protein
VVLKGMVVLSATGILMLMTGLILVDITMRFPQGASFHTFTNALLGPGASVIIGLAFCFVLYLLTYAYISGAASILRDVFPREATRHTWLPIILLSLTTSLILWAGGRLPGYILCSDSRKIFSFSAAVRWRRRWREAAQIDGNIRQHPAALLPADCTSMYYRLWFSW